MVSQNPSAPVTTNIAKKGVFNLKNKKKTIKINFRFMEELESTLLTERFLLTVLKIQSA
jgi:hypothetical protein